MHPGCHSGACSRACGYICVSSRFPLDSICFRDFISHLLHVFFGCCMVLFTFGRFLSFSISACTHHVRFRFLAFLSGGLSWFTFDLLHVLIVCCNVLHRFLKCCNLIFASYFFVPRFSVHLYFWCSLHVWRICCIL